MCGFSTYLPYKLTFQMHGFPSALIQESFLCIACLVKALAYFLCLYPHSKTHCYTHAFCMKKIHATLFQSEPTVVSFFAFNGVYLLSYHRSQCRMFRFIGQLISFSRSWTHFYAKFFSKVLWLYENHCIKDRYLLSMSKRKTEAEN